MTNKLIQATQVLKNQGTKYVLFRGMYELKRKLGLLQLEYPSTIASKSSFTLEGWRNAKIPFFFASRADLEITKRPSEKQANAYQRIIEGEVQFFNDEWRKVDGWHTNPDSKFTYSKDLHWTKVEDLSTEAGDIKFVWEKSRFSFLNDIIRYDYHSDSDSSGFVFHSIINWIDENPLNLGPNYKCSQEMSLRIFNWTFALYFYKESKELTLPIWNKIIEAIYGHLSHIYRNINFSRICVRNNHAITECLALYLSGLLFPFFPDSMDWSRKGKQWLEEEIDYQVYNDGTYIQHSHNYQRVLVQLLTWTIRLSELHGRDLSKNAIRKAQAVVDYMNSCCIGRDGQLPNYGNNDGALFFRLNDQDYSDFRPQLNALHYALKGKHLYDDMHFREDTEWYYGGRNSDELYTADLQLNSKSFNAGGIYVLREEHAFTFIKCASYRDRPAQADNLHLDIWVNGDNYFRDSGTYKYNTNSALIKYFAGTLGHNTIMLGNHDQMKKGSRFIWNNWTKKSKAGWQEKESEFTFEGEAVMFSHVGNNIIHKRVVSKNGKANIWKIRDQVINKPKDLTLIQVWHPNPLKVADIKMTSHGKKLECIDRKEEEGFYSEYYGKKESCPIWFFETEGDTITTKIEIAA